MGTIPQRVPTLCSSIAFLLLLLFRGTCTTASCEDDKFGSDCQLDCHCQPAGGCNDGQCPTDCLNDWRGPTCQIKLENIAIGKPTDEGPSTIQPANMAVDGIKDQANNFAHAQLENKTGVAWWQLDMGDVVMPYSIAIYFADYDPTSTKANNTLKRRPGYSIRISNSSTAQPPDGTLCYADTSLQAPPSTIALSNCSTPGRYLYIYSTRDEGNDPDFYSSRPNLLLTEVEVYADSGCSDGTYGASCDLECGHCEGRRCDRSDGHCLAPDCEAGWSGSMCDLCAPGWYGVGCLPCPVHCLDGVCDTQTGECTNQCEGGYYGPFCNISCPSSCENGLCHSNGTCQSCNSGYYGSYCNKDCPNNCLDRFCDMNGVCNSCINNESHGLNCDIPCGTACLDGCFQGNGTCRNGCIGIRVYGDMCEAECSNCKSGCHRNGTCRDGGCTTDYYGYGCNETCSSRCVGGCRQRDGKCTLCSSGHHGIFCENECSPSCKANNCNDICDRDTGTCKCGCKIERYGDQCEYQCPPNCRRCTDANRCNDCEDTYWGTVCEEHCSSSCLDKLCDRRTGFCDHCPDKKYGDLCDKTCNSKCQDGTCYRNGTCMMGCEDKQFYGDMCNEKCSVNISSCLECRQSDTLECLSCGAGKFGPACGTACPNNCLLCESMLNCTKCKPGFAGRICEDICNVTHCMECDHAGKCKHCEPGLFGLNCEYSCPETCRTCNASEVGGNVSRCLSCKKGSFFRATTGSCINCIIPKCLDCSGARVCLECSSGVYGEQCKQTCPSNCTSCLSQTNCTSCNKGWSGQTCQCSDLCISGGDRDSWCNEKGHCLKGCKAGKWGVNCQFSCNTNCETCTQLGGTCESCKTKYFGLDCDQNCGYCSDDNNERSCAFDTGECRVCVNGWYGPKCDKTCPSKCQAVEVFSTCNKDTGDCTACQHGSWGEKCKHSCGYNCQSRDGEYACEKDGQCHVCLRNTFGKYCEQRCSKDCKAGCNKTTGVCGNCRSRMYGQYCNMSCPRNCAAEPASSHVVCHRTNGECLYCGPGFHGETCELMCSHMCAHDDHQTMPSCHKHNGHCKNCNAGFYGDFCQQKCNKNCGIVAGSSPGQCDRESGDCSHGCMTGWHNVTCNEKCSGTCLREKCDQGSAECLHGCVKGFDGVTCQTRQPPPPTTASSTWVVIVVVVVVVLAAVLVVLLFLRRRRMQQTGRKTNGIPLHNLGPIAEEEAPLYANANGNTSVNHLPIPARSTKASNMSDDDLIEMDETSPLMGTTPTRDASDYYNLSSLIAVSMFAEYVQSRRAENREWYREDFEKLPRGLLKTCSAAVSSGNRGKCRYKNLYPYDETRVLLDNEGPNTDFINANYIMGYKKPQAFIAAQGPTDVNVNDFWRMIFQRDCGKIVMLTNLFEECKMKCVRYWPDEGETEDYGYYEVAMPSEDVYPDYTLRHLQATNMKTKEVKVFKHFHFTAWPDRGVPDNPGCILSFKDRVMEAEGVPTGPILVHCSAGIGRTGTFIALDYLIRQARAESHVDVFRTITDMRYQRTNFIQTDVQYEFVHNALAEALTTGDTEVPASEFCRYYWDQLECSTDTGLTQLQEQYQKLNEMSPHLDETCFAAGLLDENVGKNRHRDIFPVDSYRAYLSTPVKGSNEYINAVFLPTCTNKTSYLLTQMPLPHTVTDFWRLVYDQRVSTIVMMNNLDEDDEMAGEYWPSDDCTYGPFTVQLLSCENHNIYSTMTMKLTYTSLSRQSSMTVKQFRLESWPDADKLPSSTKHFEALIAAVARNPKQTKDESTIVHCMDGVERSGLFCVVAAILEQLQTQQRVNIAQTILQLRSRRPQLITSLEQYDFCHRVVADHMEATQIYSNIM